MKNSNHPTKDKDVETKALAHDPLEQEDILADFYRPHSPGKKGSFSSESKTEKPSHYKVVCLSLYTEDIEKLNSFVAELKKRGHTKANKSQVVRAALEQLDVSRVPKIR